METKIKALAGRTFIIRETKIKALARYLECETDDINENGDDEIFKHGKREYYVLTDEEANEKTAEYIKESLWAFNADFIANHTKNGYDSDLEESIKMVQEKSCESANSLIENLISDIDEFIEDAIGADGRGHFLATYDGHENEEGEYFIYRLK